MRPRLDDETGVTRPRRRRHSDRVSGEPEPDVPQLDYLDTSRRPTWQQLPPAVHDSVTSITGARVAHADAPPRTGFSGAFAATLTLDDGGRVFVKAGSQRNEHVLEALAREATVLASLPVGLPAPRLVGATALHVDDERWQVVVLQHVPGRVPLPWTERSLAAVHDACVRVGRELSPPPSELCVGTLSQTLAADDRAMGHVAHLAAGEAELTWGQPAWLPGRLVELAALVALAPAAVEGTTGSHGDLRADNVLVDLRADVDAAVLVDWNWLEPAAAWVDLVGLLPLARADGVDVDAWPARSPLTRHVDPHAIDAYLAFVVSYMLSRADDPLWPGVLPAVRVHQRRYARLFADWLGSRRGWA